MTVNELKNIRGIYKINFPNGKIYIGLSNQIRTRILTHISKDYAEHPELPISKAIHKYGIQDVEILEEVNNNDRSKLAEREIYWIEKYNSTDPDIGYNISKGGDGASPSWDNHQAKLTKEQLFELYDLLLHSSMTYEELGEKFDLDRNSIGRINSGLHYFQEGINYPLRKQRVERHELENKQDAFYGREEELNSLIDELQNSNIPMKELQKKYRIGSSTMAHINQGRRYHDDSLSYPLRKGGSSKAQTRIFSELEMSQIKEMLEEAKSSMGDIAKIFSCDTKVISAINQGTRQHQENWDYPLRKTKMKTGPKKS